MNSIIERLKQNVRLQEGLHACMHCGIYTVKRKLISYLHVMRRVSCYLQCRESNQLQYPQTGLSLRRGNIELSIKIEKCMFCGKCTLVCPHSSNIRNVVLHDPCELGRGMGM